MAKAKRKNRIEINSKRIKQIRKSIKLKHTKKPLTQVLIEERAMELLREDRTKLLD